MILDEIVESKRREAARLEDERRRLEERAAGAPPARGFADALAAGDDVAVIAEFKRRSPSAGGLAEGVDPAAFARSYAEGGAAALSVLTDGPYFGGDLDDLVAARAAVRVPVLRKDFVLEPVQVVEARAAGADAVLLIARILEDDRLRKLLSATRELGMDALVEVHGPAELDRALAAGARVVGVNARDLDTFEVDLSVAEKLLGRVPADRVAVGESGVTGRDDVRRLGRAGADGVLVGGWLMERGPDAVSELCGVARSPRPGPSAGSGPEDGAAEGGDGPDAPAVKVCGVGRPRDVATAAEAGADYVGLVMAESPRRLDEETARELAALAADAGLAPVGVFVDRPAAEVRSLAARVGLEVVQLHGDEPPSACRELRDGGLTVWKAVRPRSREELHELAGRYRGVVDALLVEGYSPEAAGGTGTAVPRSWLGGGEEGRIAARLVLAGGLDPDNVAEVVRDVRPDVVDVSSGVEEAPGRKDPALIRAFVKGARRPAEGAGVGPARAGPSAAGEGS